MELNSIRILFIYCENTHKKIIFLFGNILESMNFVFDIDGTLTPSRQKIDSKFEIFFIEWIKNKMVYLVSGSDYPKSQEQVGDYILNHVTGCFSTAGNVFYIQGKEVYRNEWIATEKLRNFLTNIMNQSPYPVRAGNHLEQRIGMINFSIVGRNCTHEQRKEYFKYDLKVKEREKICELIVKNFPELEASIGGEISIDIYPIGKNKAQIINHIAGPIHFFGDRTEEKGNDYVIAYALRNPPHIVTQVKDWQQTWEILKKI